MLKCCIEFVIIHKSFIEHETPLELCLVWKPWKRNCSITKSERARKLKREKFFNHCEKHKQICINYRCFFSAVFWYNSLALLLSLNTALALSLNSCFLALSLPFCRVVIIKLLRYSLLFLWCSWMLLRKLKAVSTLKSCKKCAFPQNHFGTSS